VRTENAPVGRKCNFSDKAYSGGIVMRKIGWMIVFMLITALSQANAQNEELMQNWHHWRGPLLTGVAPNANPPIEWSRDKNIKWTVDLPGEGSATPIIWNDKVFILTAIDTSESVEDTTPGTSPQPEGRPGRGAGRRGMFSPKPTTTYQFVVLCFDRNTGKELWRQVAVEEVPHEGHHPTGSYASASPMTDGESLYVSFGSRGFFCYTLDGELKWKQDLGDMEIKMSFGEGTSPFVYKDSLIVNWDHEGESYLYRLNAKTGEVIWKVERDEATTWSSPIVVEYEGRPQIITNGTKRSRGYDFETGELLWACGGQTDNAIPTSVVKDGIVYCTSGFRGAALKAIPLNARGDITDTDKILWSYDQDTPYVPSPLLYGDRIYFIKNNSAILSSVDVKTGKPAIGATRLSDLGGTIYASPTGAANRVYIASREGRVLVLEHADTLKVLALNELDDTFDASPAMVGNQLFLRGRGILYCIENSQ
jgi:outer membrane protein assembly factor BamB